MAEDAGLPFFDEGMQEGVFKSNKFSFYLSQNDDEPSELLLGDVNESKFEGDLTCHPVVDQLFWSLRLDDIKLNGDSLNLCGGDTGRDCIVTPDSGTSYSTMPSWAMADAQKMLPLKDDCRSDHGFGTLTYTIDGKDYAISSEHFMERFRAPDGGYDCEFTITTLDIRQDRQENLFILGDQFMQLWYTVFDRDSDEVCFAPAKHEKKL